MCFDHASMGSPIKVRAVISIITDNLTSELHFRILPEVAKDIDISV
jgi:hypothetical protein